MALIEGIKLNMGGREFVVPPLNFKALKKLTPHLATLQAMGDVPTGPQIDLVIELVHMALIRNYPDMTREDLEELLDLANLSKAIIAVMGASGMEPSVGEALGPAALTLIGAPSTDS